MKPRFLKNPRPVFDRREEFEWEEFDQRLDAPELIPTGSLTSIHALGFGVKHAPDFMSAGDMEQNIARNEWFHEQERMLRDAMAGMPEAKYL